MFTLERGICTNKGNNLKSFLQELFPFMDLKIVSEILLITEILLLFFFPIPVILLKIFPWNFKNSNVTRGHTFKIKSSYSLALVPACSVFCPLKHSSNHLLSSAPIFCNTTSDWLHQVG